jgi:glycosyl hydrolase family 106( putative alpha-L-rhamnosidase)/glycosyl hydrolase family 2/alpha-L-rhamnosidase-like protein
MKTIDYFSLIKSFICLFFLLFTLNQAGVTADKPNYQSLLKEFQNADHATYGEVPLWWWEGAKMSKERVTWQLETLADKGVKAVCPIQRSPGRCNPQSFDPDWWDMFRYANEECQRLGIKLWAYDQIGYGHYGWLEKASARTRDEDTYKLDFQTTDVKQGQNYQFTLPQGKVILARAYPLENGIANDERSIDLSDNIKDSQLSWKVTDNECRIVIIVAKPQYAFYLSDKASDAFIDMLYGKIERTLGKDSMGTSFAGVFQDEHPPTATDNYTEELANIFAQRFGYNIGRAIPALHFDIGPKTPKYRTDYYDVYLELVERTYWKKIYDWTEERNILTSHDNWGRNNIYTQSRGYIDYFRTQRWFSSPGYDDAGQHAVTERNYYDAKIASSIARLYNRPRVWNEAFHSSGWGRTTDQTLSWLSVGMALGANLYDEHGLYYSTNASTWEHAAPDPHWRQPYWHYYGALSDWVTRTSYLMSQGQHIVDAAVHYPVISLLADVTHDKAEIDYNLYMRLSQTLYEAEIENDIVDDNSILNGEIMDGKLWMGGNGYRALVFGPEKTMRLSVLEKVHEFAKNGGTVLFFEKLPAASTEFGRDDSKIQKLWMSMLGVSKKTIMETKDPIIRRMPNKGLVAYAPSNYKLLPQIITRNIDRDFQSQDGGIYFNHRRIDDADIYLVQNVKEGVNHLQARFRVDGVPEIWNPFTAQVQSVDQFERKDGYTYIKHRLEGNIATFVIFKSGEVQSKINREYRIQPKEKELSDQWVFSVMSTRDNRWGEFRWPPSDEKFGPEIRVFKYKEEQEGANVSAWNKTDFNDRSWTKNTYSMGPYWLILGSLPASQEISKTFIASLPQSSAGSTIQLNGQNYTWQNIEFSKQIGLAKAVPWGGHSGYPDGHIDRNFIQLPEGRKVLFTHINSPKEQRFGLCVELRNSNARLWVNGEEQPFEDAVGNLPLLKGKNEILLDLPDGSGGKLYVQKTPPTIQTMSEAAQNAVTPDLRDAHWIWVDEAHACYLRKTFELNEIPQAARLIVTAFSGYRLYVNGVKLEEEIGPWARWDYPESFNITPYLREGENVIGLWGQLYFGQNVNQDAMGHRGALLTLKTRGKDGDEWSMVTDQTWKGVDQEETGWQSPGFDDSNWPNATQRAPMGAEPWGTSLLKNIGKVSEPKRPLSVNLASPYLECFDEVSDIIYDIKPNNSKSIGWYRFNAPPGLHQMNLHTNADAQVWINGKQAQLNKGIVIVQNPPTAVSQVSIRMKMEKGKYGGAAFPKPISLQLKDGLIETGDWKNFAMPTYSGIGIYKQTVSFAQEELKKKTILDLGIVRVAAEVLVNNKSVGVRLARPYKFDISSYLREGDNTIEVRVANTIAPHYTTIPALHIGPTESGLLGPVKLLQELPDQLDQ